MPINGCLLVENAKLCFSVLKIANALNQLRSAL